MVMGREGHRERPKCFNHYREANVGAWSTSAGFAEVKQASLLCGLEGREQAPLNSVGFTSEVALLRIALCESTSVHLMDMQHGERTSVREPGTNHGFRSWLCSEAIVETSYSSVSSNVQGIQGRDEESSMQA